MRHCLAFIVLLVASCTAIIDGDEPGAAGTSVGYNTAIKVEAETMSLANASGMVTVETAASGGKGLLVWSNASATKRVQFSHATGRLIVRARGAWCNGAPRMELRIDGAVA